MKIFITGVAGFLGSHLADRFLALGHSVAGNDNLVGGYASNVNLNVEFFLADCCDRERMLDITKGTDILIHCAATAYEGLSVFSPDYIVRNTLQASVSTISAAIGNRISRIIYCSSMARYGKQAVPFTEDMMPIPEDPYGIAKVAGEQILEKLCDINGIEWNILVPHNIIGPRQKFDDPFRNVISIMINRCLQGKGPIIYGDGTQKRCFSYIDDCVTCIERATLDRSINRQIINIGPDEGFITIDEVADLIIDEVGVDTNSIYFRPRPLEVKYATCSSDKARQLLGYSTTTDLTTAIQHTIEYIQQQGPRPFVFHLPIEIQNDLTPVTWTTNVFNE